MDGRAFPIGNVLLFFCQTAGLLCLPCGKCFLVFLIIEAFQNRRIKTSSQPLDDFVRITRVIYSFFLLFNDTSCSGPHAQLIRDLGIPSMEKPVSILWKPEKFTSRNTKIPARSALSARMRPEPPSRADHRAAKRQMRLLKATILQ